MGVIYILQFFAKTFYFFSFVLSDFVIACWSIFIKAAFKSLLYKTGKSDIFVIFVGE